jgi:hypothetical protein
MMTPHNLHRKPRSQVTNVSLSTESSTGSTTSRVSSFHDKLIKVQLPPFVVSINVGLEAVLSLVHSPALWTTVSLGVKGMFVFQVSSSVVRMTNDNATRFAQVTTGTDDEIVSLRIYIYNERKMDHQRGS